MSPAGKGSSNRQGPQPPTVGRRRPQPIPERGSAATERSGRLQGGYSRPTRASGGECQHFSPTRASGGERQHFSPTRASGGERQHFSQSPRSAGGGAGGAAAAAHGLLEPPPRPRA